MDGGEIAPPRPSRGPVGQPTVRALFLLSYTTAFDARSIASRDLGYENASKRAPVSNPNPKLPPVQQFRYALERTGAPRTSSLPIGTSALLRDRAQLSRQQ